MSTPTFRSPSIVSRLSAECFNTLPSDDEVQELAEYLLDCQPIAGPIYQYIHKRLAYIYMKEKKNELAAFHLTESHGASLRHQAMYRYSKIALNDKSSAKEIDLKENLLQIISFEGNYALEKYQGLQRRLSELPRDWTIVQLSVQYDPLLRITHQPEKHHCVHLTRMSCGDLSQVISPDKQGGRPVTVLLSPDPHTSGVVPIVKGLIENLECHSKSKHKEGPIKSSAQFNANLQKLIKEFDTLLEDTNCLLPGNLTDTKFNKEICTEVDKIVQNLASSEKIDESQLQILYLLATSPVKLVSKKSKVLNSIMGNSTSTLASDLCDAIMALQLKHSIALCAASRHPVILILDEFLDIFPVEMLNTLKNNPASRVPSVHFIHALYREHSETILRSGINGENGYYIVNPAGDLTACEVLFRRILPSVAPKWDGIFGTSPTESQFTDAIVKKSIFLYCGHGGGNQYADAADIERLRTQAVCLLMGCSSSQIFRLGGRVDGFSLFNSYMIGGCPCTVGMLWEVTDADANRMTEYILQRWLKPVKSGKSVAIQDVCKMMDKLDLQNHVTGEPDLLRLVPLARTKGLQLKNTAALVARGLPVRINWT